MPPSRRRGGRTVVGDPLPLPQVTSGSVQQSGHAAADRQTDRQTGSLVVDWADLQSVALLWQRNANAKC